VVGVAENNISFCKLCNQQYTTQTALTLYMAKFSVDQRLVGNPFFKKVSKSFLKQGFEGCSDSPWEL
jgi:hypothetical protein